MIIICINIQIYIEFGVKRKKGMNLMRTELPNIINIQKQQKTANEELDYINNDDINKMIEYLRLPTYSLSYKNCTEKESEISCKDIIKAYETIKRYEYNITHTERKDRKYFILKHPIKGMGNKMNTDVVGFILAMMSNRTILVESNYPTKDKGLVYDHVYEFPDYVLTNRNNLTDDERDELEIIESNREFTWDKNFVPTGPNWCCYDIKANIIESSNKFMILDELLYATMLYTNEQTNAFIRENFGIHCVYFISNYFSRFPNTIYENVNNTISKALNNLEINRKTDNVSILGLHMRFHRAGQYYSHGLNITIPVFCEEIDRRIQQNPNLLLALATDNQQIIEIMLNRYGKKRIILSPNIVRKADKDHFGAMSDMILLSYSSELIATYRSTFSFIVVARTGSNAWWVEKEAQHAFPGSSSQCCGVSMIYHRKDHCDWRTNNRVRICSTTHESTIRSFFHDLVL